MTTRRRTWSRRRGLSAPTPGRSHRWIVRSRARARRELPSSARTASRSLRRGSWTARWSSRRTIALVAPHGLSRSPTAGLAEAWDACRAAGRNVRTALQRGDLSGRECAGALQRVGHGGDLARDSRCRSPRRACRSSTSTIATASDLKLLNYAPPTYPPDALRSQPKVGRARVHLGRDGSPRDLPSWGGAARSPSPPHCSGDDVSVRPLCRDGVTSGGFGCGSGSR